MLRFCWRVFLLMAALTLISFVMYMNSWSQPDMTQEDPPTAGFARCHGSECGRHSTHPMYNERNR
jgi:hypothetical protein